MSAGPLPGAPPADVPAYYADAAVRARVREYCGATAGRPPTAAFVVGFDPGERQAPTWDDSLHEPPERLDDILDRGLDVSRSLWDTDHLIFFFEIDYLNHDRPAEPFLHPADTFLKLEPVFQATTHVFAGLRLRARTAISGRGYHFVGRLPLNDPLVDRLAGLVPNDPPWFASHPSRTPPDVRLAIDARHARAAEGLGRLIEFVAHRVLEHSASRSPIPVVFNGTVVGTGVNGREAVSLDFSHAGDPLDVRHVRATFSAYQWHRQRPDIFGPDVAEAVPPLVVLPRGRHSLMTMLLSGRDLAAGVDAAHSGTATLPNIAPGLHELLAGYAGSALAAFHGRFDEARLATPLPSTLEVPGAPPCVAAALAQPNDLLLRPAHLQHVIRDLISRGWPPARVARLIEACYRRDHDWGRRWDRMDPETRAAFEVRVFAGLLATGADGLVDFNCVSAQEKGLCPMTDCPYDLRRDQARLRLVSL